MKMEKIALKVTSSEHGARVIKDMKEMVLGIFDVRKGYTETFLPEEWKPTELKLPEDLNTFRAKAALMCLSFYEVEDEERFSKAVRDANELIQELNK